MLPVVVTALAACVAAAGPQAADPSEIVARCGDKLIRRMELEAVAQRLGVADLPASPQRARAEATLLEQLVDERILRIELDRIGVIAAEAEVDAALRKLRAQVAGRGADFEEFLARSGRTPSTIRDQLALEIRLDKFVEQQITPDAIGAAFEQNRRELDGTRLRVSHILLRPQVGGAGDPTAGLFEQAAAIRGRIVRGETAFAEAARMHSAGPSRRQGGDLGWISRDGPMMDSFSSQAFRLAKGGLSEPFVTPFGVHILTVTDVEPGRIGLDAVRPRVQKILATQLVRSLVAAGRRRTPVEFTADVPHFDPATFGQSPDERRVLGVGSGGS